MFIITLRAWLIWTAAVFVAVVAAGCDTPPPVAPSANDTLAAEASPNTLPVRGDARVELCHRSGNGSYRLLSVAAPAEAAHRAHGDGAVGEAVADQAGMRFGPVCEITPAAPMDITEGTWLVRMPGSQPIAEFSLVGPHFAATGTWDAPSTLEICTTCVPGQVVDLKLVFDNPSPKTDVSFARGSATFNGKSFRFIEFGGSLVFETDAITIPLAPAGDPPQLVSVTTRFALSGNLKGFEVLDRRDPLLVFDIPVTESGAATLDLLTTATSALQFYQLRFLFDE